MLRKFLVLILFLIAVFLVSIGLMHFIHPAVNYWQQPVSWYLAMEYGTMLRIGFMAFGLAEIILGIYFINRGKRGAAFLCIAGAGAVLSGIFIIDHNTGDTSIQEHLHNYGASLQFISIPIVALYLFFREDQKGYKVMNLITGLATASLFIQMLINLNRMNPDYLEVYGILQRLLILWIVVYILVLALSEVKNAGQQKT